MKKKNYIKPEMVEEFPDTPLICQSMTGSGHGQSSEQSPDPWGGTPAHTKERTRFYTRTYDGRAAFYDNDYSDDSLW